MIKILLSTFLFAFASIAIGQINFQDISFDEALVKAKTENKKVFIDVYTDWCGPCKSIDKNVFKKKEIGDRMNPDYVSIKIEAEKDADRGSLKQFSVRAYPTMLILDGDGKLLHRIVGSKSVQGFHKELNALLPPEQLPHNIAIKAIKDNPNNQAVWRKSLKVLSDENRYQEFREHAQLYVDQFDFIALNDKLDTNIFYALPFLPFNHPIVEKILAEKGDYMRGSYEVYKKLEFTERAKNAKTEKRYLSIKAEASAYYDQLYIDSYGDIEDEDFFMEELFPKDLNPVFLQENNDQEAEESLIADDCKTRRKKRREARHLRKANK